MIDLKKKYTLRSGQPVELWATHTGWDNTTKVFGAYCLEGRWHAKAWDASTGKGGGTPSYDLVPVVVKRWAVAMANRYGEIVHTILDRAVTVGHTMVSPAGTVIAVKEVEFSQ